ncbi:MAG: FtsW/RodA/SpoVE family cell cycle protein [Oscillospiraceae bacterium]|nr:FtsW/RodA/SpoVE family cell cycle protein [Oscillospiraceae bacterium]
MPDFSQLAQAKDSYIYVYDTVLRYLLPALVFLLLWRVCKPLLTFRREPEIWAWLVLESGKKIPITHWENVIGRSKRSDIVVDFPTVSRNHAVLRRYADGSWTVRDADSKTGIFVNGSQTPFAELAEEDVLTIGGIPMQLVPISRKQEKRQAKLRTKAAGPVSTMVNLLLLTAIQILLLLGFLLGGQQEHAQSIALGFGGIMATEWGLLLFTLMLRRTAFEAETIAFFLCSLGMAAIATVRPGEAGKQLIALLLGVATFLVVGWSLRDLERAQKARYLAAVAGIGFLILTLIFGKEEHGAKSWIQLGSMTLQPSELSKVCFVFVGASTMERVVSKHNLWLFIAYSVAICGCLALMNDFGTALVFFVAFLVIAFMRSGSVGTVGLAITGLGFAGVMALRIAPHALRRFATWRHIWEDPLNAGYQQTRSLMCIASGGLFGLGAGNGWMKNNFAADSDMVFATVSEEWGLLIAIMAVLSTVALAVFAVRCAAVGRSSFYTIGACTAASILIMQVMLNVLGTVDALPLTGVTFPFLSNGGTSMICAWGLLGFMKSADTRQNASFAVRITKEGRDTDE